MLISCNSQDVSKVSNDINKTIQEATSNKNTNKTIEDGIIVIGSCNINFSNVDSTLTMDDIKYYVRFTELKCKAGRIQGFDAYDVFLTPTGRGDLLVMMKFMTYDQRHGDIHMIGQVTFNRVTKAVIDESYDEVPVD